MRNFLGTLTILALLVAGVGFYRGWFDVSTDDQPGITNVELTIDKDRISQDAEAASAKARDLTSRNDDQSGESAAEVSESDAEHD
jgi:hypothetical protein